MDEMTQVRALWAEQAEPGADRLSPARRRLLAEARSADASPRGRARLRRRVVLAAGLAVAVTGGAIAVEVAGGDGPASVVPVANAAQVLNRAADTAAAEKWTAPRPGQYVVVQVRQAGGVMVRGVHGPELWPQKPLDHIMYYEAAGPGAAAVERLVGPRPSPGHRPSAPSVTCPLSLPIKNASYAAMLTWPTDPTALRAFLLRNAPGSWWGPGIGTDRRLWETAQILVSTRPVPPQLRAALFRVLAGVPGVRVVPGGVDGPERHAIAVTRRYATGDVPVAQEQDELVFDSTTYRFLGLRGVTAARTGTYPAGTPLGSQTLIKIGVVNRLPAGVKLDDQCT